MWVSDQAGLMELCRCVDRSSIVALDTEFAAERRYFPRFDLLQIGTPDIAAAVDVRARLDLGPLFDRLCAPDRTVILHSGSMDLAILYRREGRVPQRIFDTQVAAAMLGYGAHIAYSALVRKITGVHLAKSETLTDWSRRPLKAEQVEYALDDVKYLPAVYRYLREELIQAGRLDWLEDECRRMVSPDRLTPPDPKRAWQRIGGWRTLSPRQFGVLQTLAAWREELAVAKNVPARVILPDNVLLHLARRQPTKIRELREIRQIFDRTVKESGEEILRAVRRGIEEPDETTAEAARDALPPEPPPGLVSLLQAIIQLRAAEEKVAPNLLASSEDLERLVDDVKSGTPSQVPLVHGWRRDVAGRDVLHVLSGTATVQYAPGKERVLLHYQTR